MVADRLNPSLSVPERADVVELASWLEVERLGVLDAPEVFVSEGPDTPAVPDTVEGAVEVAA